MLVEIASSSEVFDHANLIRKTPTLLQLDADGHFRCQFPYSSSRQEVRFSLHPYENMINLIFCSLLRILSCGYCCWKFVSSITKSWFKQKFKNISPFIGPSLRCSINFIQFTMSFSTFAIKSPDRIFISTIFTSLQGLWNLRI